MVNAVDLYRLFAEIAGVKLDTWSAATHTLDAQSVLPYLKKAKQPDIRKTNFTQQARTCRFGYHPVAVRHRIGPDLHPAGHVRGPLGDEGGTWYGPDGAAGADGIATCCDVNTTTGQNYTVYPLPVGDGERPVQAGPD